MLGQTFPLRPDSAIPAIGLGTYLIDPEDVSQAVQEAIAAGYRHIDTAAAYQNEAGVGDGIRAAMAAHGLAREDIFVTTKFAPGWIDQEPKSYEQTIAEANESFAKLGMDYVDLYLIHAPFGREKRVDQWRALIDLQAQGKARAIGVSNFAQHHLEEIDAAGLAMPAANQLELHPWSQKPDLLAYMRAHEILPIAYSSLVPHTNWRHQDMDQNVKTDELAEKADVFVRLADKYGVTEAQFLLRWGVQSGFAILPKSLNPGRIRENAALDFVISDEDMEAIAQMDRGDGIAWPVGDPLKLV